MSKQKQKQKKKNYIPLIMMMIMTMMMMITVAKDLLLLSSIVCLFVYKARHVSFEATFPVCFFFLFATDSLLGMMTFGQYRNEMKRLNRGRIFYYKTIRIYRRKKLLQQQ